MSERNSLVIGIDLGTVNSCMAIYDGQYVKILETRDGKTTPSFVFYDPKSNDVIVGETGKIVKREFENGIYDSKRFIGRQFNEKVVQSICDTYPFQIVPAEDGVKFEIKKESKKAFVTPQEVSSEILKYFGDRLNSDFDFDELKAVITVPAYFNNNQRNATLEAAKLAGIEVIQLLNEPTAASIYYHHITGECNKTVMVFDLGGGTFDVSVVEIEQNDISVKCIDGHECLGGRNLDYLIYDHFIKEFEVKGAKLKMRERMRLKPFCEQIKKKLSKHNIPKVCFDTANDNDEDIELELSIDEFCAMSCSVFEECIKIIDRCLTQNNLRKDEIDDIVLVGGSTKIPKVQEMLSQYFEGKEIKKIPNPDLAVAAGASILAYNLENMATNPYDNEAIDEELENIGQYDYIHVKDVTSFSIGTEIIFKGMHWAINKNTPIPTEGTINLKTCANNQREASIDIYEGRWNCSLANNLLGKIIIDGLPEKPRGEVEITIHFSVDENNILSVTGEVEQTGIKENLKISLSGNDFAPKITDWDDAKDSIFERIRLIKCIIQFECDDYINKNEHMTNTYSKCSEFISKLKNISNTDMNELNSCICEFLNETKFDKNNSLATVLSPVFDLMNADVESIKGYLKKIEIMKNF